MQHPLCSCDCAGGAAAGNGRLEAGDGRTASAPDTAGAGDAGAGLDYASAVAEGAGVATGQWHGPDWGLADAGVWRGSGTGCSGTECSVELFGAGYGGF